MAVTASRDRIRQRVINSASWHLEHVISTRPQNQNSLLGPVTSRRSLLVLYKSENSASNHAKSDNVPPPVSRADSRIQDVSAEEK